jgi:methylthioribose-1-phosphate isomerase
MTVPQPIAWTADGAVRILDQTRLPDTEHYLDLATVDAVAEAIRTLRVRGAPLIGITAAMGLTLAVRPGTGNGPDALDRVRAAARLLNATRPTAVNLRWALDRMERRAERAARGRLAEELRHEADAIWAEDRAMCRRIGEAGARLIGGDATVLTHCNAGALATGGIGTALAPVYLLHEAGRHIAVVADETRPLLQGSRLTAWELTQAGVPVTVIADGMAASRLRRGDITCVIVGADRIAANGDVANKIGTYGVALAARAHGVPFYVAAPTSTIDPATPDGDHIPIEERAPTEVSAWRGHQAAAAGAAVWNPAFDVTPAELVTAIITDRGVVAPRDVAGVLPPAPAACRRRSDDLDPGPRSGHDGQHRAGGAPGGDGPGARLSRVHPALPAAGLGRA